MKTVIFIAVLLSACILRPEHNAYRTEDGKGAKERVEGEHLEISFRFRRGGIASSQYAIWIEDESGKVVRTVYATSFTVKGGYAYRKEAIPTWVHKANPAKMSPNRIDAITGVTPRDGTLNYIWDGKSDDGKPVPKGTYTLFVEGTLYWKSRIVYSGKVNWGSQERGPISVTVNHYDFSSTNKDMITELKVFHSGEI